MKKAKVLMGAVCVFVAMTSSVFSATLTDSMRYGVGGVVIHGVGGLVLDVATSLQAGVFTRSYDVSIFGSYISNDLANKSDLTAFGISGSLKTALDQSSSLTYGAFYKMTSGKFGGMDIDSSYTAGITVGIQKELANNVLLDAKLVPVSVESIKFKIAGATAVNTTTVFGQYLLGVTYLF